MKLNVIWNWTQQHIVQITFPVCVVISAQCVVQQFNAMLFVCDCSFRNCGKGTPWRYYSQLEGVQRDNEIFADCKCTLAGVIYCVCVCVCVWHYLLELKAWNSTGSIRCGLRYNKSTTNRDSGVWALVCKSQLAQAIPREALRHAYNRAHRAVHRAGRWVWSTGDGRQSTALGHVHRPVAKGC